jgi:hypothetical protein
MNQKLNIASTAINGDWCNLKLTDGKELSINIKSNPKLAVHLAGGQIPQGEIEANVVEKNGKFYGWDPQETKPGGGGGFKKETPEERSQRLDLEALKQRMIVAQSSLSASVQFYQQRSGIDALQVQATAAEFYKFVMELSK